MDQVCQQPHAFHLCSVRLPLTVRRPGRVWLCPQGGERASSTLHESPSQPWKRSTPRVCSPPILWGRSPGSSAQGLPRCILASPGCVSLGAQGPLPSSCDTGEVTPWKLWDSACLASSGSASEKTMAPNCSTRAWRIPWMEGPDGLQSMGSLGVGHD